MDDDFGISTKPTRDEKIAKLFEELHKQVIKSTKVGQPLCMAADRGMYRCNRRKGHDGMHVACTPEDAVHAWVGWSD
jgi:hypothetical protein